MPNPPKQRRAVKPKAEAETQANKTGTVISYAKSPRQMEKDRRIGEAAATAPAKPAVTSYAKSPQQIDRERRRAERRKALGLPPI